MKKIIKLLFVFTLISTMMIALQTKVDAKAKYYVYEGALAPYKYKTPHTVRAVLKKNKMTLKGSYVKYRCKIGNKKKLFTEGKKVKSYSKKFVKTFKLSKKVKYYGIGGDGPLRDPYTKKEFNDVLKHPNGLGLYIIVKNNVVVEAYLCS